MSYLVCKDTLQLNQRDVPDEICDGFLHFNRKYMDSLKIIS
jgi:hypothetical protein